MEMVGLFALTALLLAGLGIYGVISYTVSACTHEIGIRLALGAQRRNILSTVLRQGLRLAVTGAAVGFIGALLLSHLMRSEEHTSELQSHSDLVCRLLLEKKKKNITEKINNYIT